MQNMKHEFFMKQAIVEAMKAVDVGEVPIGAVAVIDNKIIARAHNLREATGDPLGHAEILLLTKLKKKIGDWRFEDVTVYVTCEPCIMCMGALLQSRVKKVVFGCMDPKAGACGSLYDFSNDKRLNHRIEVVSGVMVEECRDLLKQFFKKLRKR